MWNRWNFAFVDELIGEAIVFRGSLGVSVQGREGFKEHMRTVRRAFPDFHNRVEELIAEDDKVVARLTYTGTHDGELFGDVCVGDIPILFGTGVAVHRLGRKAGGVRLLAARWGSLGADSGTGVHRRSIRQVALSRGMRLDGNLQCRAARSVKGLRHSGENF